MEMSIETNRSYMVVYLAEVWGKKSFFNKCCPNNWIDTCKEYCWTPSFPCQKRLNKNV
jgi:hypothetical protein